MGVVGPVSGYPGNFTIRNYLYLYLYPAIRSVSISEIILSGFPANFTIPNYLYPPIRQILLSVRP